MKCKFKYNGNEFETLEDFLNAYITHNNININTEALGDYSKASDNDINALYDSMSTPITKGLDKIKGMLKSSNSQTIITVLEDFAKNRGLDLSNIQLRQLKSDVELYKGKATSEGIFRGATVYVTKLTDEPLIVHELIHSILDREVANNEGFRNKIVEIYNTAVGVASNEEKNQFTDLNLAASPKEMLAYFMSGQLNVILDEIKEKEVRSKLSSILKNFYDFIASFFGAGNIKNTKIFQQAYASLVHSLTNTLAEEQVKEAIKQTEATINVERQSSTPTRKDLRNVDSILDENDQGDRDDLRQYMISYLQGLPKIESNSIADAYTEAIKNVPDPNTPPISNSVLSDNTVSESTLKTIQLDKESYKEYISSIVNNPSFVNSSNQIKALSETVTLINAAKPEKRYELAGQLAKTLFHSILTTEEREAIRKTILKSKIPSLTNVSIKEKDYAVQTEVQANNPKNTLVTLTSADEVLKFRYNSITNQVFKRTLKENGVSIKETEAKGQEKHAVLDIVSVEKINAIADETKGSEEKFNDITITNALATRILYRDVLEIQETEGEKKISTFINKALNHSDANRIIDNFLSGKYKERAIEPVTDTIGDLFGSNAYFSDLVDFSNSIINYLITEKPAKKIAKLSCLDKIQPATFSNMSEGFIKALETIIKHGDPEKDSLNIERALSLLSSLGLTRELDDDGKIGPEKGITNSNNVERTRGFSETKGEYIFSLITKTRLRNVDTNDLRSLGERNDSIDYITSAPQMLKTYFNALSETHTTFTNFQHAYITAIRLVIGNDVIRDMLDDEDFDMERLKHKKITGLTGLEAGIRDLLVNAYKDVRYLGNDNTRVLPYINFYFQGDTSYVAFDKTKKVDLSKLTLPQVVELASSNNNIIIEEYTGITDALRSIARHAPLTGAEESNFKRLSKRFESLELLKTVQNYIGSLTERRYVQQKVTNDGKLSIVPLKTSGVQQAVQPILINYFTNLGTSEYSAKVAEFEDLKGLDVFFKKEILNSTAESLAPAIQNINNIILEVNKLIKAFNKEYSAKDLNKFEDLKNDIVDLIKNESSRYKNFEELSDKLLRTFNNGIVRDSSGTPYYKYVLGTRIDKLLADKQKIDIQWRDFFQTNVTNNQVFIGTLTGDYNQSIWRDDEEDLLVRKFGLGYLRSYQDSKTYQHFLTSQGDRGSSLMFRVGRVTGGGTVTINKVARTNGTFDYKLHGADAETNTPISYSLDKKLHPYLIDKFKSSKDGNSITINKLEFYLARILQDMKSYNYKNGADILVKDDKGKTEVKKISSTEYNTPETLYKLLVEHAKTYLIPQFEESEQFKKLAENAPYSLRMNEVVTNFVIDKFVNEYFLLSGLAGNIQEYPGFDMIVKRLTGPTAPVMKAYTGFGGASENFAMININDSKFTFDDMFSAPTNEATSAIQKKANYQEAQDLFRSFEKLKGYYKKAAEVTDGQSFMTEARYNDILKGVSNNYELSEILKDIYVDDHLYLKMSTFVLTKKLATDLGILNLYEAVNEIEASINEQLKEGLNEEQLKKFKPTYLQFSFNSTIKKNAPKEKGNPREVAFYNKSIHITHLINKEKRKELITKNNITMLSNKDWGMQLNPKQGKPVTSFPSQPLYFLSEHEDLAKEATTAWAELLKLGQATLEKKTVNNKQALTRFIMNSLNADELKIKQLIEAGLPVSSDLIYGTTSQTFLSSAFKNIYDPMKFDRGGQLVQASSILLPPNERPRFKIVTEKNSEGKEVKKITSEVIVPKSFLTENEIKTVDYYKSFKKQISDIKLRLQDNKENGTKLTDAERTALEARLEELQKTFDTIVLPTWIMFRTPSTGLHSMSNVEISGYHEQKTKIVFHPYELAILLGSD